MEGKKIEQKAKKFTQIPKLRKGRLIPPPQERKVDNNPPLPMPRIFPYLGCFQLMWALNI